MMLAVGYDIDEKRGRKRFDFANARFPVFPLACSSLSRFPACTHWLAHEILGVVRDPTLSASSDEHWMRAALAEAKAAAEHGDVPVGCIVVTEQGELLATGHNRREIDSDPTAHAEIVAVRAAARARGHWRLDGCTAFVTLEPCSMCAGALVNARVSRVVFGAADPKAGAVATLFQIGQDARLNHRFQIETGVLATESVALLQSFFAALRARGEK